MPACIAACLSFAAVAQAAPNAPTAHKPATSKPRHGTKKHGTKPKPVSHNAAKSAKHKAGAAVARKHSDAVFPSDFESTPAYRYAQLTTDACWQELEKRELPVRRETESWPGITAPVRFTGPMNGVTFRTDILESERATSPYELFDCRLVLALDDFTKLLRAEKISEVVLSSAYRPPPKSIASDEQARRHAAGLAIDMHRFRDADGNWIKIEQDFHGRIGASSCGKSALPLAPQNARAALLRRLVCGAAEQRLFQSILTPNYDYPHRNHLHFELTAGVRWFIVS